MKKQKVARVADAGKSRSKRLGALMGDGESELLVAHKRAVLARAEAYAPYSKFKVGAVIITKDGQFIHGCNIENASYGGTVCAERVAFLSAVSRGLRNFRSIIVVTDAINPVGPCALCLQTMAEFCEPGFDLHIANLHGVQRSMKFRDYLSEPFGPRQLLKAKARK